MMSENDVAWIKKYGPWAMVTGASDGIGLEMARNAAGRGLNVILVARNKSKLTELARSISDQFNVETSVMAADLSVADNVESLIANTKSFEIGLLISAAGFGTSGAFVDIAQSSELNMLDLNCRASLALAHAFAQRFVVRKRGGLVLFSSLVAFQGVPFSANYAASKAYMQTLAEGLSVELKHHGVDVLSVAPGPVHTGFAARSGMTMGAAAKPSDVAREAMAALGRKTTVRPGLQAKVLMFSLGMLPRGGRSFIMGKIMSSMIKSKV